MFTHWSLDIIVWENYRYLAALPIQYNSLNAQHTLSLLLVGQRESRDAQICTEMFWWHHRHNHFWHISVLSLMTFWQIFLCYPFSIHIGFPSKSIRISNAFLRTLCHQFLHHCDHLPFLCTDVRKKNPVTFWGVLSSFDQWITLYEESQRANYTLTIHGRRKTGRFSISNGFMRIRMRSKYTTFEPW